MSFASRIIFLVLVCAFVHSQRVNLSKLMKSSNANALKVGVVKIDASLPIGVPLAGYNHGDRRVKYWPIPDVKNYTVFMSPSIGRLSPTWAKCAVLQSSDEPGQQVALMSMDMIGADGGVLELGYLSAVDQGLDNTKLKHENVIMGGSHSHSGPGAVTGELLWSLAPATDVLNTEARALLVESIGKCLVQAQQNMKEASLAVTYQDLYNVTHNRRAHISPYVKDDTVDHQLTVIRIDDKQTNQTMAAIWNFAIHGICLGEDNMKAHGDIMGTANELIEAQMKDTVSLFFNADAGDVTPGPGMCKTPEGSITDFKGSHVLADYVLNAIQKAQVTSDVSLVIANHTADFGLTNLNLTLARVANCTHGGPIDVCTWCSAKYLNCDINLHLGANWVENRPRFNAIRLTVAGQDHMFVTVPGEALTELGKQIKANAQTLGFPKASIIGYANNHLGYFAPADEYEIGGYEGLLSFWGIDTAERVRNGALSAMTSLKRN